MNVTTAEKVPEQQVGRYAIFDQLAAGGMATVHLARLVGSAGFSRVVAAKRMHRHFLKEPEFRRMFLAEARLAARILHPNVVPVLDVLSQDDDLIIIMEYVHGDALHSLIRTVSEARKRVPIPIGCAIVAATLQGLHAAHEARDEKGETLGIVHRDVSPQNIMVGADGVARVLDFGIAKAISAQNVTDPGTLKGKFSYMAPEAINGKEVSRQADVFSAAVVLWELLTGRRLFNGASEQERMATIVRGNYPSPRKFNPRVTPALERVVENALQPDTCLRYSTALEFAIDIEQVVSFASQRVVSEWVRGLSADKLNERSTLIHDIETTTVVQLRQSVAPQAQSLTTHAPTTANLESSRKTANALPPLRQSKPHLWALGGVAILGALAPVLYIGAQYQPVVQGMVAAQTSNTAPISSISPSGNAVLVQHDLVQRVETPSASSTGGQTSTATERRQKDQHLARRAVLPAQTPAQPVTHGKHYLPAAL
jgi:eukaryotic-like serine/threonine-protein kinase